MYTKNNIFSHFISLCIMVIVTFSMGIKPTAAALILDDQSGEEGSTATFTVSIDSTPNEVAALGFEVRYDPSILRYREYSAGSLVSGFDFFDANNASPGTVRVGGFVAGSGKIDEGESGTAVSLTFDVVGHEDCEVRLAQLKDDIKSWNTEPGYFSGDHAVEEEPADNPEPSPTEEEPADNPAPSPADSPIGEEIAGNPTPPPGTPSMEEESPGNSTSPSATPAMEHEPGSNTAPPPAGPPMSTSFNNIRYRGDTYHYQVEQPTNKAGDLNYSVYLNPDAGPSNPMSSGGNFNSQTSKSVGPQHHAHKRGEAGKSHQRTKMAKLANNREILTVARAMANVDQTTANLNKLPDMGQGVQKDGFRALIATMILFGSIYYLAIGSTILFVGYLFWELIKMGRR